MRSTTPFPRTLAARLGMVIGACVIVPAPQAQEPPLIPRKVLFGNPERTGPQISPDGRLLAYLAPDQGVLNIWVRTVGRKDDRPLTHDRTRPIYQFFWQGDSRHLLHLQDQAGDENWRLYQTTLATGEVRDLTVGDSVQTQVIAVDPNHPDTIVVAWNARDRTAHDAYRLDLRSGRATLVAQNPGDVQSWTADNRLGVRVASATLPDGGTEFRVRDTESGAWRVLRTEGADETFSGVVGFTADDQAVWLISSVGANAARLLQVDLRSGRSTTVAEDSSYDVSNVLIQPTRHLLQAVEFTRERAEWQAMDSTTAADFQALRKVRDGDLAIPTRTRDDRRWVVSFVISDGPISFYLYDRETRQAEFLFTHRPALERYRLAKMQPVSFVARDGLPLHGYLTVPPGTSGPSPTVVLAHGGPWGRDTWGYNPLVQWLANRGYVVLQVNFRGSTGYGKAFVNAGDREWGAKMHTDVLDGKAWAIAQGYANPDQICIFGGSYGGYETLAALAFTPDEFRCGVDLFGPSNLVTLIQSIPPYWASFRAVLDKRMGKLETEETFLRARSPLSRADSIRAPLLIVQGANDVRVKQAESDQIVAAMRRNGKEVIYIVFPDEGHGFARPENNLKFTAAAEGFFARYLHGRVEPPGPEEDPVAFMH